jgi:cell division protein FtsL
MTAQQNEMTESKKALYLTILAGVLIVIFVVIIVQGGQYVDCINSWANLTCVKPWWML